MNLLATWLVVVITNDPVVAKDAVNQPKIITDYIEKEI